MPTPLWELASHLSEVMHWLGKHEEANMLAFLSRFLKCKRIENTEKMEKWIESIERGDDQGENWS